MILSFGVPDLGIRIRFARMFQYIHVFSKEYKEEAQCAQKGGRMLVFVICGFIKIFFPNFYFTLQIYHVKSFKIMHVTSMYFNFSLRYS